MHRVLIALALVVSVQGAIAAQGDKSAVMAPVHQFVDAFNKGDAKTAAALCATEASIIDEFPPHELVSIGAGFRYNGSAERSLPDCAAQL